MERSGHELGHHTTDHYLASAYFLSPGGTIARYIDEQVGFFFRAYSLLLWGCADFGTV